MNNTLSKETWSWRMTIVLTLSTIFTPLIEWKALTWSSGSLPIYTVLDIDIPARGKNVRVDWIIWRSVLMSIRPESDGWSLLFHGYRNFWRTGELLSMREWNCLSLYTCPITFSFKFFVFAFLFIFYKIGGYKPINQPLLWNLVNRNQNYSLKTFAIISVVKNQYMNVLFCSLIRLSHTIRIHHFNHVTWRHLENDNIGKTLLFTCEKSV